MNYSLIVISPETAKLCYWLVLQLFLWVWFVLVKDQSKFSVLFFISCQSIMRNVVMTQQILPGILLHTYRVVDYNIMMIKSTKPHTQFVSREHWYGNFFVGREKWWAKNDIFEFSNLYSLCKLFGLEDIFLSYTY